MQKLEHRFSLHSTLLDKQPRVADSMQNIKLCKKNSDVYGKNKPILSLFGELKIREREKTVFPEVHWTKHCVTASSEYVLKIYIGNGVAERETGS